MKYASLHNHTDASLLDGVIKPVNLLKKAIKRNIPAVAITDHGNMGAHLEAQIEGAHIENCPKIIFGSEMYFVDDASKTDKSEKRRHIILLAKNEVGYRNLIKLNNQAWRNFYYTPRIDFNMLKGSHEGLICTSACAKGVVGLPLINDGDYKAAKKQARKFKDLFDKDFYLELMLINIDQAGKNLQEYVNINLRKIGKHLDIPLIITNDVHYLDSKDHVLHQKVLQLSREGFIFETEDLWLKPYKALLKAKTKNFKDFPNKEFEKALDNTLRIADQCNHTIDVGKQHIPKFPYKNHIKWKGEKTKNEFFKNLVYSAYVDHVNQKKISAHDLRYQERIDRELDAIFKMDAVDYFLIVEDLVKHLRRNEKLVMIRGSANGSLVCYLLEFGYIDPVKHNILFERFISPARAESGLFDVDIDIDMESEARPIAVDYLKQCYSEDEICNVGSYGRLMWRACIKDMARVEAMEIKRRWDEGDVQTGDAERLDQFSFQRMNEVTKFLEAGSKQEGGDISVEESLEKYPQLKEWWDTNIDWIKTFVEPIVGIRKSASVHPASVVILPGHMDEWLPIRSQPNPKNKSERILCTQWETSHTGREDLRAYGTMALDILGVKTLSIIARTFRDIEANHSTKLSMDKLPLDDKKTIKAFVKGETLGVFQLNAPSITQIVKDIKPDCFSDVVNLTAIDRPGALANKAHVKYQKRKHGQEKVTYGHKSVKKILEDTYGIPIYSEHIMLISMAFAGFSPIEAEKLRQLMKSKDRKVFAQYEEKFIEGAKKLHGNDIDVKAEKLWKTILKFGAYAFPKAHASSYGLISWATMYLKTNYPAEFLANHLNYSAHDEYSQIRAVAKKKYKVTFVMPEINKSKALFVASRGKIIWSLAGIKGIGGKALDEIVEKQPYSSFNDFYNRVNKRVVNKARIQALILANTFRNFGDQLNLLQELCEFRRANLSGKKKEEEVVDPKFFEYGKKDWLKEKAEYLGFQSMSYFRMYRDKLEEHVPLKEISKISGFDKLAEGKSILLFGQASNVRVIDSRAGRIMSGEISDIDGTVRFVVWKDKYDEIKGKEIVRNKSLILIGGVRRRNKGREDYSLSIGEKDYLKVIAK